MIWTTWERVDSPPETLVYRDGNPVDVGVVFVFAGVAACICLFQPLLFPSEFPYAVFLLVGSLVGLFALVGGLSLLIRRKVSLNRSTSSVTISYHRKHFPHDNQARSIAWARVKDDGLPVPGHTGSSR